MKTIISSDRWRIVQTEKNYLVQSRQVATIAWNSPKVVTIYRTKRFDTALQELLQAMEDEVIL